LEEKYIADNKLQKHGRDAKDHGAVAEAAGRKAPLAAQKKKHAKIRKQKEKCRERQGRVIAKRRKNFSPKERRKRARSAASGAIDMKGTCDAAAEKCRANR
jgi:hypothetical protein